MSASSSGRRYISRPYGTEQLFLVYKHKKNSLSSDGPYNTFDEAQDIMRTLLSQGVCAWMVSYNERKG
tara:strand:+ start:1464 stop:1667 length:204 start_codon:yes stop_codon:yes gene_type:complete